MRTTTTRGAAALLAAGLLIPTMAFAQTAPGEAAPAAAEEPAVAPAQAEWTCSHPGKKCTGTCPAKKSGECKAKHDGKCHDGQCKAKHGGKGKHSGKHDGECTHGDHFERIETMRMWGLTRELDLSEDETARLFPMLSRNGKERREIFEGMQQSRRKLRGLMRDKGGDVDTMKAEIDGVFALEQRMLDLRRSEFTEVEKLLGAERAVRFAAFEHKFRKRVHELVRDHHEGGKHKGAKHAAKHGGAPDAPDAP